MSELVQRNCLTLPKINQKHRQDADATWPWHPADDPESPTDGLNSRAIDGSAKRQHPSEVNTSVSVPLVANGQLPS
jgi:hypothetical protein